MARLLVEFECGVEGCEEKDVSPLAVAKLARSFLPTDSADSFLHESLRWAEPPKTWRTVDGALVCHRHALPALRAREAKR